MEGGDHGHHGDEHAHIADAVHDERLLGGHRVGGHVVPEADEQVRGQAYAFPPGEEADVRVGQHQREHRSDEEVQVGEETSAGLVVLHVGDRVHVDERADEGDEEDEGDGQRIDEQAEVHGEITGGDPREEGLRVATRVFGGTPHLGGDGRTDDEGRPGCEGRQQVAPLVG